MGDIRKHVVVSGRVQGVGFRYWTRGEAERLGVRGWVKNRADGRVEAEIEGDPEAVSEMLDALGRGPSFAVVDDLAVTEVPPDGEPGFRITTSGRGGMSGWFRRG